MSTKINDEFHVPGDRRPRPRDRAVPRTRRGRRPRRLDGLVPPGAPVHPEPAITAMVLAERLAAGYGDDDPFVLGWREELGL